MNGARLSSALLVSWSLILLGCQGVENAKPNSDINRRAESTQPLAYKSNSSDYATEDKKTGSENTTQQTLQDDAETPVGSIEVVQEPQHRWETHEVSSEGSNSFIAMISDGHNELGIVFTISEPNRTDTFMLLTGVPKKYLIDVRKPFNVIIDGKQIASFEVEELPDQTGGYVFFLNKHSGDNIINSFINGKEVVLTFYDKSGRFLNSRFPLANADSAIRSARKSWFNSVTSQLNKNIKSSKENLSGEGFVCGLRFIASSQAYKLREQGVSSKEAFRRIKTGLEDLNPTSSSIDNIITSDVLTMYTIKPRIAETYLNTYMERCIGSLRNSYDSTDALSVVETARVKIENELRVNVKASILADSSDKTEKQADDMSSYLASHVSTCMINNLKKLDDPMVDEYLRAVATAPTVLDARNSLSLKYADNPSAKAVFTQIGYIMRECVAKFRSDLKGTTAN